MSARTRLRPSAASVARRRSAARREVEREIVELRSIVGRLDYPRAAVLLRRIAALERRLAEYAVAAAPEGT